MKRTESKGLEADREKTAASSQSGLVVLVVVVVVVVEREKAQEANHQP